MSSNPPKPPRLIIANKEALKELEVAGLRDPMLKKYDVTLHSQLKEGRREDDPKPDPQLLKGLRQMPHLSDVTDDDVATAALMVQGAFGDGARVVGLPDVLNREVEWLMLSRDREHVSLTDRRALSTGALADETFPDNPKQRSAAHEAMQDEKAVEKLHHVDRKWDKERRANMPPFKGPQQPSLTEYYKRMGRVALDDGSVHQSEALDQLATSRYDMLLDFEKKEVPRQVGVIEDFVSKSGGKYEDISKVPQEEISKPGGPLRKEFVDVDIAKRKENLEVYSAPGTSSARKKHLEMEMVKGRHLTPPNHQTLGSQNNAFGTISPDKKLESMLLEQMEKYNDSRYPTVPLEILR